MICILHGSAGMLSAGLYYITSQLRVYEAYENVGIEWKMEAGGFQP